MNCGLHLTWGLVQGGKPKHKVDRWENHIITCYIIAQCTFSSTLTLSVVLKKQEGLRLFKCREAELYSQREDLQLYRKRRESKMEMLSVALGCLLLQSNRLAGMQDALWIRSGYKRQSKLLVQSDSFHHPRRWRVKSLCNILSLSLSFSLSLSLKDIFGWEHYRCWLLFLFSIATFCCVRLNGLKDKKSHNKHLPTQLAN